MGIDLSTLLYAAIVGEDNSGRPNLSEKDEVDAFKKKVDVTVLIPAYNEAKNIEEVVERLYSQSMPPDRVFLLDDISTDNTDEIAGRLKEKYSTFTHLIVNRKAGKAKMINCTVKDFVPYEEGNVSEEEKMKYLTLVIDADTFLYPDSLEKMIENFYDEEISAVTGSSINKTPDSLISMLIHLGKDYRINIFRFRKRAQSIRNSIFVVNGGYTMYRTEALKEIPFPTRTRTEDTDHTWTLLESGRKVIYEPDALSYSLEPESLKSYWKQLTRWFSGTHQCLYYHAGTMFKSPGLAFSTVLPGIVDSFYSYTFLALPFIASYSPALAGVIIAADVSSTILFGTFIEQRRVDRYGELRLNEGNFLKRYTVNFFQTVKELPGIFAFKFLSSAAWIYSEWKTALELVFGQKRKWGKSGWESVKNVKA